MSDEAAAEILNAKASKKDVRDRIIRAFARFESFCGLLQIVPKSADGVSGKRIPFRMTPLQATYCAKRTSRDIILKPRQVGFSTLECARDIWWFTKPGTNVLVVVQSQTDMAALKTIANMLRVYVESLQRLGLVIKFGRESSVEWTLPDRDSSLKVIVAGASEAAADRKGRGGTIRRLHMTELAFWGDYAQNAYLAITESVPRTGSESVVESTANGAGGYYYELWSQAKNGKSAYKPYFVGWFDHPEYQIPLEPGEKFEPADEKEEAAFRRGITPEQLKWRRWKVLDKGGDVRNVDQEYPNDPETCFLVEGSNFFDVGLVSKDIALANAAPKPVAEDRGRLLIWEQPKVGSKYVISADSSEGRGGDAAAAIVLERGTGAHVASLHGQIEPYDLAEKMSALGHRYNDALLAPERNNHGVSVIDFLVKVFKYENLYVFRDLKLGWHTNTASRPVMLDALDAAHRKGEFKTNDLGLLGEMHKFVVNKLGKPEAAASSHDDRVLAAAIAWRVATMPEPKPPTPTPRFVPPPSSPKVRW